MEILGKRIPGLQDAVFSGLESVTAGIKESTKASGISALGIAANDFSFGDSTTAAAAANLPGVIDGAAYPGPGDYGKKLPEPSYYKDIFGMLLDPNFRADRGLSDFTRNLKTEEEIADLLKEDQKRKQEAMERSDKKHNPNFYLDTALEDARDDHSVEGIKTFDPAVSLDAARGDRSIEGGVAGGSSSDASSRSIIVVGGKTSDTFFATLDDSAQQLQQNPTPEISQLYRDQVGAVQNMVSTVDEVVQMQTGLMSSMLLGGLRI